MKKRNILFYMAIFIVILFLDLRFQVVNRKINAYEELIQPLYDVGYLEGYLNVLHDLDYVSDDEYTIIEIKKQQFFEENSYVEAHIVYRDFLCEVLYKICNN